MAQLRRGLIEAARFAGVALLWAVIDFFRADVAKDRRGALYRGAAGHLRAWLHMRGHANDALATMRPLIFDGLLLALAAVLLGFRPRL